MVHIWILQESTPKEYGIIHKSGGGYNKNKKSIRTESYVLGTALRALQKVTCLIYHFTDKVE